MNRVDELERENRALRERLSRLGEAGLRITGSLDLDVVLAGVLDSARALTEARYGVAALVDGAGEVERVLTSGLAAEESSGVAGMPQGSEPLAHLSARSEPLRLADALADTGDLRLTGLRLPVEEGAKLPFLAVPIVHGGGHVGALCVADRDDGRDFSLEDEDALVMLAAQAAGVIANARRYRDEQRARSDLETLIETAPVGVLVLDARTGAPVSANHDAVGTIERFQTEDTSWEQLLSLVTVIRADGRKVSLSRMLEAGETVRMEEIELTVPDGRSANAIMSGRPIRGPDGSIVSLVVTLQDLTPLQELERLRAEFLAMVSHELRTPLAAVKGSVATLLDPSASLNDAERLQFHRVINAQADRMRVLISDLLDVAQIETGTLAVSPEPTDLALLVGEAGDAHLGSGGQQGLQVQLPPDLPWVLADRARTIQVLGNLLSNAARHSHSSTPIRVTAAPSGAHVAVAVSDRGRGIPAESLGHVFRRFSRTDDDQRDAGSGLGLAICRGIVEAQGGRIWAESDGPGLGTHLIFTIPRADTASDAPASAPLRRPTVSRAQLGERRRIRILAADDDPEALRYIREVLVNAGYEPLVARDSEGALRLMSERPRLVLLDLMLPGMDGIKLMEEIQKTHDTPVIFVTAYGLDELIARAFDSGAADYVLKPFSPTELSARIRAALRRYQTPERAENYRLGALEIDYARCEVTLDGQRVPLTAIEYRTLAELASNAGAVVTHTHLLRRVWDTDTGGDVRPIRTVVSTLRRRLGDDADDPRYLFTEPRVGYRMAMPEAAPWPPGR